MDIVILGGGPAGLYCALLIKKAHPAHNVTIIERNPEDVTYGWGVVFSDRTLASFQRADYKTYEQIASHFVIWDAIDVYYRSEKLHCGGHVISSISRKYLLNILQRRCLELGVKLKFGQDIHDLTQLGKYDLLIAADGINSLVRKTYESHFKPHIQYGKARYIWLGANKVLDAFTFIFCENEHGLFQVHAYPFSGTTSTFIVECDEASWLMAGLDRADEAASLAYCQHMLVDHLNGATLLSNNSKWISFPTLKTQRWHYQNIVLLGDAIHTAHFSIGSGTKLAMEDAISLASLLEQHSDLETALNEYELERKPIVEVFQRAAQESQAYFETLKRYLSLEPVPFTFQLLTRSGRITYDDLKLRDIRFGDMVDRWWHEQSAQLTNRPDEEFVTPALKQKLHTAVQFAAAPVFTPFKLRSITFPNRLVAAPLLAATHSRSVEQANPTLPGAGNITEEMMKRIYATAFAGTGLTLSRLVAVSATGRITHEDAGIYTDSQANSWAVLVTAFHRLSQSTIAIELNHAGPRGSTRPRSEGLDRPMREQNWPLLAASALPYTPFSQTPKAMKRTDMDQVIKDYIRAVRLAQEANFDMLQLNMAHGYLLASFLSPLTNHRSDEYGRTLEQRMRYPLEVFDAVRAVWPQDKPLSVSFSASDCVKGGFNVDDAILFALALKERGCDIIEILAGQTTIESEPAYRRGFLTSYSERIRNEVCIPTLVGGYLTTSDEVNTIIAAGRADLCIVNTLPEQQISDYQTSYSK
jgi:anthraniloyl-CoA monooxygenase